MKSHHNPADLASRGMTASELVNSDIWLKYPTRISFPRSDSSFKPCTQLERHVVQVNTKTTTFTEKILNRFSDLSRALLVLYVFRFYHSANKTHELSRKYLSIGLFQDEISFVKRRLIILCQGLHFPEYSILKKNYPTMVILPDYI